MVSGNQTKDWNDKIIDEVVDFVCMLLGFGLVFTIYKIVKRFCSRPLMNVDSIVEIGNNDVVQDQYQGNNSDDDQSGEVNPFLNDEEGASAAHIATSKNHFLTSFHQYQCLVMIRFKYMMLGSLTKYLRCKI